MKKLFLVLLIAGFVFPFGANGQPPGYLGKRASVSLNYSVFPAFFGPTKNTDASELFENEGGGIGLNNEFSGSFNYAVSRYRSLGLEYGRYKTGMYLTELTFTSFPVDVNVLFRLNVNSIGLTMSKFKKNKGALAPVGNRFYWGIKRNFVNSKVEDFENAPNLSTALDIIERNKKVAFNYLLLGWSNDNVFWDKVLFNVGFNITIPLKYRYLNDLLGSNTPDDIETQYELAVFERLMLHEFLRINVGVGYLLF